MDAPEIQDRYRAGFVVDGVQLWSGPEGRESEHDVELSIDLVGLMSSVIDGAECSWLNFSTLTTFGPAGSNQAIDRFKYCTRSQQPFLLSIHNSMMLLLLLRSAGLSAEILHRHGGRHCTAAATYVDQALETQATPAYCPIATCTRSVQQPPSIAADQWPLCGFHLLSSTFNVDRSHQHDDLRGVDVRRPSRLHGNRSP